MAIEQLERKNIEPPKLLCMQNNKLFGNIFFSLGRWIFTQMTKKEMRVGSSKKKIFKNSKLYISYN